MTEDLNTRLENAAKGITPQTCPDERRRSTRASFSTNDCRRNQ